LPNTAVPPPQGSNTAEQLHDHGADAGEEAGAELAFQNVGQAGSGWTLKVCGSGYRSLSRGAKTMSQPAAAAWRSRRPRCAGSCRSLRQELQAVHEDAGHQRVGQWLAWRTRAMWPSCRLPMVGTKAGRGAGQGGAQFGDGAGDLHGEW
jgi:hypothetical protein